MSGTDYGSPAAYMNNWGLVVNNNLRQIQVPGSGSTGELNYRAAVAGQRRSAIGAQADPIPSNDGAALCGAAGNSA